ncbi:MAG: ABC transporter permease [Xanthobacteraceae bacterium]
MNILRRVLGDGSSRAWMLLGALLCLFLGLDQTGLSVFGKGAGFSVLENFATFGPVALGLALTMLIREFDISMAGMFSLAGCVAVRLGQAHPGLGLLAALGVGVLGGAIQGLVLVRLNLGSVPVTLGGLLTFFGMAYVLTGNRTVDLPDLNVALAMNEPILGVFSLRSILAVLLFAIAAFMVAYTRIGRDMVATGSDPRAAKVAGVRTEAVTIGVFAASGTLFAVAGALMSYSLSAASPSGLSDVTVPAIAAVILGGASPSRGTARPLGTAAGVLILCLLRTGLTSLEMSPHVHEMVMGSILMIVAISDGPDLTRHLYRLGLGGGRDGSAP